MKSTEDLLLLPPVLRMPSLVLLIGKLQLGAAYTACWVTYVFAEATDASYETHDPDIKYKILEYG